MKKKFTPQQSLLWAVLVLFPLLCYPHRGIFGVLIAKYYGLLVLALLAGIFLVFKVQEIYPEEKFLYALLLWAFLSTLFAGNKGYAFFGAPYRYDGYLSLFCYGVIYLYFSRYGKLSNKLILAMLLSGIVVSFLGFAQFLSLGERYFKPFKGRAYGLMGNPDFYGSYLTLLLPFALYWLFEKKFFAGLLLFITLFIALGSSMTRSAWIGSALGLSFFIVVYFLQGMKKEKVKRLAILLLCMVLLFGGVYASNEKIQKRVVSIFVDIKAALVEDELSGNIANNRGIIWKKSWDLVVKYPLFGVGPDNMIFEVEQKAEGAKLDKAHNEYLDRALSTGVPSLIFYMAFISIVLLRGLKKWKDPLNLAILSALLSYLIQAFLNIAMPMVFPVFMALLGAMSYRSRKEEISC